MCLQCAPAGVFCLKGTAHVNAKYLDDTGLNNIFLVCWPEVWRSVASLDNAGYHCTHSCRENGRPTLGQSVRHPLQDNNLYHLSVVSRFILVQHVGFDVERRSAVSARCGRRTNKWVKDSCDHHLLMQWGACHHTTLTSGHVYWCAQYSWSYLLYPCRWASQKWVLAGVSFA